MDVGGDIFGGEVHQGAVAFAEAGEAGLVEHGAAVREVHAAVLVGLGGSIAGIHAGFRRDEVRTGGVADRRGLVMADPGQRIHIHVGQALDGADQREVVGGDLAGALEGRAGHVDALHHAGLDGLGGLHELDLLRQYLRGMFGADGLHGVQHLEAGIDGILDGGHAGLGVEVGDLAFAEAADVVDAGDPGLLHAHEVFARGVAHVAVDVGAGGHRFADQADDAQVVLDVVVGHGHDPQAEEVAVLGEAAGRGDDVLVGHGEGLHLRVVLGKGAEAAVRRAGMAGVADLGE